MLVLSGVCTTCVCSRCLAPFVIYNCISAVAEAPTKAGLSHTSQHIHALAFQGHQ